jgi:gluconate 2-dehydrogenase gamma chain
MDFMMIDQPGRQTAMRGGLAWIDRECVTRFDKTFRACTTAERTGVLDDIAWPRKAPAGVSHGVAFFNAFRDLTASGFWTSRMGIKDLDYRGNVFVPEWTGCPDAVLKKLGVG